MMTTSTSSHLPRATIGRFRAELRDDAVWVATTRPRLTWEVVADVPGWIQAWAEVRAGDQVARLESAESVLVDWPFDPLAAGAVRTISVRAASTDGILTPWSEDLEVAAAFEENWVGQLIAVADADSPARPALFRTSFQIDRPVRRALLQYSALGVADYTVNGFVAGDEVLTPGWTSYQLRLVHETADVTGLVHEGENVLSARLAGGWYTEEYHVLTAPKRFYGDQPRLVAQLRLFFEDGTSRLVGTSDAWRAIPDPETWSSGIYAGERADRRGAIEGWDLPGFDDAAWPPATVVEDAFPRPEARMAPPVRRIETVAVRSVLASPSGGLIVDFGQNLVGRLRIRVRGDRGTRITLRHAEVLDEGELALRPLRLATATDEYILAGEGLEQWEPRFTFHGFRYAQIDGWPGEFDPADVEAVVLSTDMRRTGWFTSSDKTLNRFHENVVWTTKGNYLSVPMDCPQRDERLGWTGDTQLFAPTAAFLYDCESFYLSWLRDLALEQEEAGGVVPLFAPNVLPDFATRGPVAGWGDAIAIIPQLLVDATGNTALLAEFYPSMRAWTDVVLGVLDSDGLWTAGRQTGDWLDPNAPPNAPARGRTDTEIVATAYFVHTTRLVARIARQLGHTSDADRFRQAAEVSCRAYVATYISPNGRMMCDTQTAYALTIAFDLVDDPELRTRLSRRLADVVRRDGYHIATGLLGTAVIAQALTAGGNVDAIERLLFQTEAPSWLYPVTVGATTVWERWDGLREDGSLNPGAMVSFNHVALGSVADWLHRDVAGLSPAAPGYARVRIAPRPLRRLDYAHAEHLTPYGRAASGWKRSEGKIRVTATVPPNTSAEVFLPDGRVFEVLSGQHEWNMDESSASERKPVTLDSSMADLADDERAYAAFYQALQTSPNVFVAKAIRSNALYREALSIRDALVFCDPATLLRVDAALVSATNRQ